LGIVLRIELIRFAGIGGALSRVALISACRAAAGVDNSGVGRQIFPAAAIL